MHTNVYSLYEYIHTYLNFCFVGFCTFKSAIFFVFAVHFSKRILHGFVCFQVYLYIYVQIYMYMYSCIFKIHVYVYTEICHVCICSICICIHKNLHAYLCAFISEYECSCIYICIYMNTCIYIHMYIYTQAHTYICVHIYIHINSQVYK